jgi:predicted GH43/DUF377 family glycosyl hydrolase
MWYVGRPEGGSPGSNQFGYTTSRDGLNWERATPVLAAGPPGAWDEERIGGLEAIEFAGVYHLYYAATTLTPEFLRQIGCAYSRDLRTWTRCEANPLLTPRPNVSDYEGNEVEEPDLLIAYGKWLMAYSGYGGGQGAHFQIGIAHSDDGERWQRLFKSPALDWGPPGAFDEAGTSQPTMLLEGNELWLWYTGLGPQQPAIGVAVAKLG